MEVKDIVGAAALAVVDAQDENGEERFTGPTRLEVSEPTAA
jgi:hypothetical protein